MKLRANEAASGRTAEIIEDLVTQSDKGSSSGARSWDPLRLGLPHWQMETGLANRVETTWMKGDG